MNDENKDIASKPTASEQESVSNEQRSYPSVLNLIAHQKLMDIGDNSEPNKGSAKSRKDKVLDSEKAAKVKQIHSINGQR